MLVAGFPLGGVIQNNGFIVSVTPGKVPATCSGEIAVIGLPNVPPNPDQLLPVLPNVKPGFTPMPGQTALTGPFLDAGGQVVLADPVTVPGITLAPLPGLTIPFLSGTVNPIVSVSPVSVPRTPGLPFQNLVVIQPFLDVSLFVGQRITYTFFVINNGNTVSATTILRNSIPPNALFIRGTCQVNNEMRLDAEPDKGINLGPIPINQSVEVRFDLLITGGTSLANFCTVTAAFANQFTDTISTQTFQSDVITNPVLAVAASDLSTLIKTANVKTAVVGDVFQYNVTISNLSTDITAANVIFYDVLDMTLQYVSGSLTIDGVPQMDPQVGVTLGTIGPGVTRHLSFKVRSLLEPAGDHIVNTGVVFFEFRFGASCFRAGLLSNPSVIVITPEEEE